jgi:hypothetical protein
VVPGGLLHDSVVQVLDGGIVGVREPPPLANDACRVSSRPDSSTSAPAVVIYDPSGLSFREKIVHASAFAIAVTTA